VIGSGAHTVIVRQMLAKIGALAEREPSAR
jgi:hypothetical protein